MLLFRFKTLDGAMRRMRFENAHSKTHRYSLVYCDEAGQELQPLNRLEVWCYRLRKERKTSDVLT